MCKFTRYQHVISFNQRYFNPMESLIYWDKQIYFHRTTFNDYHTAIMNSAEEYYQLILNSFTCKLRISQFTVAVWAWADKGHCRTNFEIHGDEILDTCSWKLCNIIHSCTFSALHGTQVEVFFEKGEQRLFIKHLHRYRSDYFKMYKVGPLHVSKICGYSGSLQ